MKKLLILFILFLIPLRTTSAFAKNPWADRTDKKETYRIASHEVVNHDVIAASEVVEISGIVNGDVYAGGGEVFVDGTVNGDLLAAGGKVHISGIVTQDLRVVGGQVTVNGVVSRNTSVVGGNIEITDAATLQGSLVTAGGNVTVSAPVAKDIYIGAGNAILASTVGGNVTAGTGDLRVTSRAQITGDLTYWSDSRAEIAQSAKIGGQVNYNPTQRRSIGPAPQFVRKASLAGKVFNAITTFVVGLLLALFFPALGRRSVSTLSGRPLASFGTGLLSIPIIGAIFFILAITLIGIPLAILIAILYFIMLYLARMVFIYWMGSFVLQKLGDRQRLIWGLVMGILVYMVLSFIPVIGKLTTLFATMSGLGAVILSRKGASPSTSVKTHVHQNALETGLHRRRRGRKRSS